MTLEGWMVLVCSGMAVGLALLAANGTALQAGLRWGLSNRDAPFAPSGWVARAHRTHRNHLENLPVFVAVVVALGTGEVHSSATEAGALLFVLARALFAAVYISGWNPFALRTILYFVSLGSLLWMVSAAL